MNDSDNNNVQRQVFKDLIIRLINDDIKYTRLITGLNALGLSAHNYTLQTSDLIFELMHLQYHPEVDEIHHTYYNMLKMLNEHNEDSAHLLYNYLEGFVGE